MDPTQLYETMVANRDTGDAVHFITVPARSLVERTGRDATRFAEQLGFDRAGRVEPVEAWSLPFLIDVALGNFPQFPWTLDVLEPGLRRRGHLPSSFAQHIAYAPIVPFEQSPLEAKSLAEVLATAGPGVGAVVGYLATDRPLILIVAPAGIIIVGAALGIARALEEGLRQRLLRRMGIDPHVDESRESPAADDE